MPGKKFKQRKTDVIQDGIVYRMYKEVYSVYTYTEDLPEIVYVADKIGDITVTFLDSKCFLRSECREVILPNTIERIGSNAFGCCKNLENVSIPNSIKGVSYDAFERCENLKHTLFSYGLYLGNVENPFLILHKNDRAVKSDEGEELVVEVHPETKIVLSSTFNHYSPDSAQYDKVDKLILHDNLEHIDGGAFSFGFYGFDYAKIKTICVDSMEGLCKAGSMIPGAAKTLIVDGEVIGDTIIIPASVTKITSQCFYKFDSLKTVHFEGNISEIEYGAFENCQNLKEVYFPHKVGHIHCDAFSKCPSLKKIEFFEVEEIDSFAFELEIYYPGAKIVPSKTGLREVVFHNRVGRIGYRAFGDNSLLKTVVGLENVENIEGDPFVGTPFETKVAE